MNLQSEYRLYRRHEPGGVVKQMDHLIGRAPLRGHELRRDRQGPTADPVFSRHVAPPTRLWDTDGRRFWGPALRLWDDEPDEPRPPAPAMDLIGLVHDVEALPPYARPVQGAQSIHLVRRQPGGLQGADGCLAAQQSISSATRPISAATGWFDRPLSQSRLPGPRSRRVLGREPWDRLESRDAALQHNPEPPGERVAFLSRTEFIRTAARNDQRSWRPGGAG